MAYKRRRFRPGYHLVVDDESGLTYFNDQVKRCWDGSIRHHSQYETRHPQEFVRSRNDPYLVDPIRSQQLPPITENQIPLLIGNTSILTPFGPATHLFRQVSNEEILFGIGEMIIEDPGEAGFYIGVPTINADDTQPYFVDYYNKYGGLTSASKYTFEINLANLDFEVGDRLVIFYYRVGNADLKTVLINAPADFFIYGTNSTQRDSAMVAILTKIAEISDINRKFDIGFNEPQINTAQHAAFVVSVRGASNENGYDFSDIQSPSCVGYDDTDIIEDVDVITLGNKRFVFNTFVIKALTGSITSLSSITGTTGGSWTRLYANTGTFVYGFMYSEMPIMETIGGGSFNIVGDANVRAQIKNLAIKPGEPV